MGRPGSFTHGPSCPESGRKPPVERAVFHFLFLALLVEDNKRTQNIFPEGRKTRNPPSSTSQLEGEQNPMMAMRWQGIKIPKTGLLVIFANPGPPAARKSAVGVHERVPKRGLRNPALANSAALGQALDSISREPTQGQ